MLIIYSLNLALCLHLYIYGRLRLRSAYVDIARWDMAAELCELVYSFKMLANLRGDGSLIKTHKHFYLC